MASSTMLELRNPFHGEGGVIRLLESEDCDREQLIFRRELDSSGADQSEILLG